MKKKLQFVQEYLDLHKIAVRRTAPSAAQAMEEPQQKAQPSPPIVLQETTVTKTIINEPFVPTEPLDINTASESALAAIPGIGIILAKKAISIRNQKGKFESVDDFISSVGIRSYQEDQVRRMLTCPQADSAVKDPSTKRARGRAVEY